MGKTREVEAGRAYVSAYIRDNVAAGLKKVQAKLSAFAATSAKIGGGLLAGGAAGLGIMGAAVNTFLDRGDQWDKMAARTGATVEQLSSLGFAMNEGGADAETLEKGIIGLQKNLLNAKQGAKTAVDAFGALGLTVDDLDGKAADEQIKIIADRLDAVEDPGTKAAMAMEIFGKAGQKMLPAIKGGRQAIEALQKTAGEMGATMSGEDATNAAALTDRLYELKEAVVGSAVQVGAALAPSLIRLSTQLVEGAKYAVAFVKENRQMAVAIAAGLAIIAGGGVVLLALAAGASGASMAIGGLTTAVSILGGVIAFLASPIGLVSAALVLGVGYWAMYTESGQAAVSYLTGQLGGLLSWAQAIFGGIYDAIAIGDWSGASKIMWTAIQIGFNSGIGALRLLWFDFSNWFVATWDDAVSGISKGLLFLIEKANQASEYLSGYKLIDIDTQAAMKSIDQDNQRRDQQRAELRGEVATAYSTDGLQAELDGLIKAAAERRKEFEDAKAEATSDPKQLANLPDLATIAGGSKSAAAKSESAQQFGSFSAAIAGRFNANNKNTDKRTADATEDTADNTARMVELLESGGQLLAT